MSATLLSAKAFILGGWFVLLAVAERALPAAPRLPDAPRLIRNLGLWLLNTVMNPLITLPIGIWAASVQAWARPDWGWPGVALDLILLDLWTYVWHRANHQWPLLWRFHRVHHLDQFLDATSAVRFHPGEVLISALARTPLIVAADVSVAALLLFDSLMLAGALFHHSNLRLPRGLEAGLRLLLVTPSHHWVHHHVAQADTNSNYGAVLTLWDRLFGSWSPTQRTPEMKIGAGDDADLPLTELAVAPFRR